MGYPIISIFLSGSPFKDYADDYGYNLPSKIDGFRAQKVVSNSVKVFKTEYGLSRVGDCHYLIM